MKGDSIRIRLVICLAAAAGTFLPPSPARAAEFFHGEPRPVRACVLLLPSTSAAQRQFAPDGQNQNPYLFYVLDQRQDLKPQSWEFENPIAPPTVTQEMANRWRQLSGPPLTVGVPLTRDMAAYWEVALRPENIDRLVTMDVCYVSATGIVPITYQDRELLRRLVDAGVLLWIDNRASFRLQNGGRDNDDGMFFPLDFAPNAGVGAESAVLPEHPLLDGRFRLTPSEISTLGVAATGFSVVTQPPAAEGSQLVDPRKPGLARPSVLQPVVGAAGGVTIAAAQYGGGYLLATANDLGGAISQPAGTGARVSPNANLLNAPSQDLKLAYNAIAWTDEVTHVLKDPHRNAAGGDTLAGALERWSYTGNRVPYPNWLHPLIAHNQVFALTTPSGQGGGPGFLLHSFQVNPLDIFAANGANPDDGLRDLSLGQNYDQIAAASLGEFSWISGMAYGEVDGSGYLFATGGQGGTFQGESAGTTLIEALKVPTPANPQFVKLPQFTPPPGSKDVNVRTVWSAPAFFDGLVIAAGGTQGNPLERLPGQPAFGGTGAVGDMRALRLVGNQLVEQWHYPQGNAPEVGPIVGPVVVANLSDPRSGATDTTVLFTSLRIASSPGGLGGIVIHTAGEPLIALDDGRTWQPTRRMENWDPNEWYDIRVIDNATGLTVARYTPANATTAPVQFNVENQPGRIRLPTPASPTLFTVVAEYSLLNNREAVSGGMIRRYWVPAFNVPGGQFPSSGISAGPSVDAKGNVYMATGNGYVASVHFVSGTPIINWKARTDTAGSGEVYTGVQQVVEPFKPDRLVDHLFTSTPTWKDNILYVAGRDGVVYAFETQTDFTVKVPFTPGLPPMSPDRPNNTVLYSNEGDPSTFTPGSPPRLNRVPPDSFSVNPDSGTITITNMRNITLDMSQMVAPDRIPPPGIGNRFGMPIAVDYIDVNGTQQHDTTYIPLNLLYRFRTGFGNGAGALWSQKYVFESSPVIAGDHVYVIGNQSSGGAAGGGAPGILQQGPAVLFDLPADPRKLDNRFIAGSDVGSWPPAGAETTRPAGWMVSARLISAGPVLAPPAISDNLMVTATEEGITAYQAAKAIVADANRVLEVGADGRAIASMDATTKLNLVGSDFPIPATLASLGAPPTTPATTTTQRLDRPAVARQLNRASSIASVFYDTAPTEAGLVSEHSEMAAESLLIADTGNNRVVETNPAGKVIWELTSFQDPFHLLPPGEPLRLSEPMDAQRWVDTEKVGGNIALVFHTLVADTGNTRVIEIVDKIVFRQGNYSPSAFVSAQYPQFGNVRWYHVLVWTSQTNAQGLHLRYRTAQRVYRTDINGNLAPNPGVAAGTYPRPVMSQVPFLPMEPYEALTMATVSNARVFYVSDKNDPHYGDTLRNIPQSLPGADSIVFLLSNRTDTAGQPFWTADPTSSTGYKYVQGTIGNPSSGYPILSDIWTAQGGEHVAHELSGVTSVERNVRVNLADKLYNPPGGATQPRRAVYYLVADAGGVFEFRYDPSAPVTPPTANSPFTEDHGPRLAWAFTNDDYNWVTGGGNGNPNALRPGSTGAYTGGQTLTAASARLMTNGQVLIASRTAGNAPPAGGPAAAGGGLFALRITDYDPTVTNGPSWHPDLWVQSMLLRMPKPVLPSITWRAPAPLDPLQRPTPMPMPGQNFNPLDLGNTYLPDQPAYADLLF